MRRALALAVVLNVVAAVGAAWHVATRPLSIESLVGPPATPTPTPGPGPAASATDTPGGDPARPDGSAAGPPGAGEPDPQAPRSAPRVRPAPGQVRRFKREIAERVRLPPGVRPTQRQVEGVSEEICKAFDRGYTYGQVVEGLKKAGSRYALGVSSQDAAYAVDAAVESRCPAHASKLP